MPSCFTWIATLCLAMSPLLPTPLLLAGEDSDPAVRYEPCPEFWDEVSAVLKEQIEAVDAENNRRRTCLQQALIDTESMRSIPLPVLQTYQRVRVYPPYIRSITTLFIINPNTPEVTYLNNDWCEQVLVRTDKLKIEQVDFSEELQQMLEEEAIAESRYSQYFAIAYFAHASKQKQYVRPLLRVAFQNNYHSLERLRENYSLQLYWSAIARLPLGADRKQMAYVFSICSQISKDRWVEAEESSRLLLSMAKEDQQYVEPEDVLALPIEQQVAHWIFKLRDARGYQMKDPGHCWIPMSYPPPYDEWSSANNPTEQLIRLGFDAVPSLIDSLDDKRFTRSYGFRLTPKYPLKISDAALQTLQVIAGRSFYQPPGTTSYYSRETDEDREAIKQSVIEWWERVKDQDESQFLRDQLEMRWKLNVRTPPSYSYRFRSPIRPLYRLALREGKNALPDMLRWIASDLRYESRDCLYRLALQVDPTQSEAIIRKLADPDNQPFNPIALRALYDAELLTSEQYHNDIYHGYLNTCRRSPDKPSYVNVSLLMETKKPEAMVLAAAYERVTRPSYSQLRSSGNEQTDRQMVEQLLPWLTVDTAPAWLSAKVNELLGSPIKDTTREAFEANPERRKQLIDICQERGIEPAESLPWG